MPAALPACFLRQTRTFSVDGLRERTLSKHRSVEKMTQKIGKSLAAILAGSVLALGAAGCATGSGAEQQPPEPETASVAQQYVYEGQLTSESGEAEDVEFSTVECVPDFYIGLDCYDRIRLSVTRANGAEITYVDNDFDMRLDVLLIDGQRFDGSTPLGDELLAVGQGQFDTYLTRILEARTGWALERLGADSAEDAR